MYGYFIFAIFGKQFDTAESITTIKRVNSFMPISVLWNSCDNQFDRQFNTSATLTTRQEASLYVPIFGTLEFINYMGLLKVHTFRYKEYGFLFLCQVAQCLINPFGDDEDDFDIDQIILRNFEVMIPIYL